MPESEPPLPKLIKSEAKTEPKKKAQPKKHVKKKKPVIHVNETSKKADHKNLLKPLTPLPAASPL